LSRIGATRENEPFILSFFFCGPDESAGRGSKADALAKRWGFGPELEALDEEAETVLSP